MSASDSNFDWVIRSRLIPAFEKLWSRLEPIAYFGKDDPINTISYKEVEALSQSLRNWYFDESGGMYLSLFEKSKDAYIALQTSLNQHAVTALNKDKLTDVLTPSDHLDIREKGRTLRHAMVDDLNRVIG
jgi:hypothetical protein